MSLKNIREQFRSKEISAEEQVKECFKKINENKDLNIFINEFQEDALKKAQFLERLKVYELSTSTLVRIINASH